MTARSISGSALPAEAIEDFKEATAAERRAAIESMLLNGPGLAETKAILHRQMIGRLEVMGIAMFD